MLHWKRVAISSREKSSLNDLADADLSSLCWRTEVKRKNNAMGAFGRAFVALLLRSLFR